MRPQLACASKTDESVWNRSGDIKAGPWNGSSEADVSGVRSSQGTFDTTLQIMMRLLSGGHDARRRPQSVTAAGIDHIYTMGTIKQTALSKRAARPALQISSTLSLPPEGERSPQGPGRLQQTHRANVRIAEEEESEKRNRAPQTHVRGVENRQQEIDGER